MKSSKIIQVQSNEEVGILAAFFFENNNLLVQCKTAVGRLLLFLPSNFYEISMSVNYIILFRVDLLKV